MGREEHGEFVSSRENILDVKRGRKKLYSI